MTKSKKGSVSKETFDEFLAEQGMLDACEDHAIKEIIAEQLAAAMKERGVNALDRLSTEFARTIVSAILEAF